MEGKEGESKDLSLDTGNGRAVGKARVEMMICDK